MNKNKLMTDLTMPLPVKGRPRSRLPSFSFFVHHYALIQGVVITAILFLSAFSYGLRWIILALSTYWLYFLLKTFFKRKQRILGIPYESEQVSLARSLLLTSGIFVLLLMLYSQPDYSKNYKETDTLWLLFFLPTFILSQRGKTQLLRWAVIYACLLLGLLYLISFSPVDWKLLIDIAIKISWLMLFAFVIDLFVHYIRDWYESFRRIGNIEEELINFRAIYDFDKLLQKMVNHIATAYEFPHVNLFQLSGSNLRSIASYSASGNTLVDSGFLLQIDKGINGYVAREGKLHVANDVEKDDYYVPHPAFPNTKAELAAPIIVQGQLWGVLDIQVNRRYAFFQQDIEVMDTLSRHLGVIIDDFQLYESGNRIASITRSIALRFLSQHELKLTLDEIANAAFDEFRADFVVIYERNPQTDEVTATAEKGELFENQNNHISHKPGSFINMLISGTQDYFDENLDETKVDTVPSGDSSAGRRFIQQQKIVSRVIMRLRTNTDCMGLMIVNFRSHRKFDEHEKQKFYLFAHLAALTLQKSSTYLQQLQTEREQIASDLHDRLMASANGASRIITTALKSDGISDKLRSDLRNATDALYEMQADLHYLNETLKARPCGDLDEEIGKVKKITETAYGIIFDVERKGDGYVPPAVTYQIRPILNEVVLNAVSHGDARVIHVRTSFSDDQVVLTIEDDGRGFDMSRITPRGLQNIIRRVGQLGGKCTVSSIVGEGTCVEFSLPVGR